MRRPSADDIRNIPFVGSVFADLCDSVGLVWDELPDIIPDDTGDEAFQRVLMDHLISKGWSEEDLTRPFNGEAM